MRSRRLPFILTVICLFAIALFWLHRIHTARATEVAPYTAHLIVTKEAVQPDGSTVRTVSIEVLARDRQGRVYQNTGHGSVFIENPLKQQTLTWGTGTQVAILGQWPYWSGRRGCWEDEHGQNRSSFATDEDWHDVPASPGGAKLETAGTSFDPSSGSRIKTRFVTENLGDKQINGLTAYGIRMTQTPIEAAVPSVVPHSTTELWKSKELDLTLLRVSSGPGSSSRRVNLSNLERGDPDPALFAPPQNYKIETVQYHQVPCQQQ